MAKTYYCGLCNAKMTTDLSLDEEELRKHYRKEHPQEKAKKVQQTDGVVKDIVVKQEPFGMTMYTVEG